QVLFFGAFIVLLNIVVYGGFVGMLTILPIYLFGIKGYVVTVSFIAGAVALVYSTSRLRRYLVKQERAYKARLAAQAVPLETAARQAPRPKKVTTGPTFVQFLVALYKAMKEKACPIITFKSEEASS